MVARAELPQVEVTDRAALRQWLEQHHGQTTSVWLVTFKRRSPHYVPYEDIVEEALCFGWVDSQPKSLDEERSMRLLSPRRSGSSWSKVNKDKVVRLIAEGRMTSAGMAAVESARRDGSWSALDQVERLVVPKDLSSQLAANPAAAKQFEAFPRSSKRLILEWINNAKKPETRAKRIKTTVEQAAINLRANHARQPLGR